MKKNFRWWPLIGVAAVGAGLAGCGGNNNDSNSGSASLRLANATLTHPSLDLLVNATASASATAADTVSAYGSSPSGSVTLQVNGAGSGTALATTVPTLTGGNHYTLLAYETGGAVKTTVLNEDFVLPATGVATLRVLDLATEAGKLDVYVTPNACTDLAAISASGSFSTLTPATPLAFTQGAGTYNVCVTALGSKTDLRLAMPVTLAGQQVVTALLTPASGGQLLNGSLLTQQGAYAATRNTNARVRLAAAVSGGATVAATASNGKVVDSGSVAPAFGFYTLVPATSTLNVTVNSASIASPSAALKAGGDATLLVYEAGGVATAKLIDDDNRLPTDATSTKLRLINGVTGSAGTLTLTANTAPVGINVAPGTASGYATVPGSTNPLNLTLSSSTNGTYPANTSNTLLPNSVYSVLAGGPVAAPVLLIR